MSSWLNKIFALAVPFVELLLKDNAFVKGLARAGKMLKTFAIGAAAAGAATVAAGAAIAGVGLKNFLALGDELDKMRQRTGLSVESLSELKHAAGQSGASLADVEKGVRRMQKGLVDAQRGLATSIDAFEDLGLSVDDLSKMSPEEQFNAVAEAIGSVEDPSKRAGLAMNVFGKAGTQLLPMIEDMGALRQEARDLGFVLSGEAAASAVRVGDMFANLWSTLKMGPIAIGAAMSPMLETVLPIIQTVATSGLKWIQGMTAGIVTVMDGLRAAWSIIWESIGGTVSSLWGSMTETTGSAMEWLQNATMTYLKAVSFYYKEWGTLVSIAIKGVSFSVVKFANETIHFFGTVIPGYLQWFGRNWTDIFRDIANYTGTVVTNMWNNLVNFWKAVFERLNGGTFNFRWTDLEKGFESSLKELPQIAEREIGGLEKQLKGELDALRKSLKQKWDEHSKDFDQRVEKFRAGGEKPAEQAAQAFNAMAGFDAAKAKKEVFVAFTAAAAMAGGRGQSIDAAQETRKEQLQELRKVRRAVEEGGALA